MEKPSWSWTWDAASRRTVLPNFLHGDAERPAVVRRLLGRHPELADRGIELDHAHGDGVDARLVLLMVEGVLHLERGIQADAARFDQRRFHRHLLDLVLR